MERDVRCYVDIANQYTASVLSGEIPACKWVKAACRRQLDDLERSKRGAGFDFVWFPAAAEYVCQFIELLPHIKGKWAGEKIRLESWQIFIITTVFGWHTKDGNRRFRTVYIEVPRKNAKSTLTSAVSLYMLTADDEPGAEIYSAATTREQARIVFEAARDMAVREPTFRKRFWVGVREHSLFESVNGGKYIPLSAEGSTLDGLNIHFAGVDELHAHRTRAVYDVIETATGSRTQSLVWSITTSGDDQSGICYEQREYVCNIMNSVLLRHDGLGYPVKGACIDDETYFGIVYTIDEEDDWTDEQSWRKANPNYGVSVYPDDIRRLAEKAKRISSARNNFLTKRLDIWVNASVAWMDMRRWEACANKSLNLDDFTGEKCWIGMDLAEKSDFAAIVLVFWRNGTLYAFPRLYLNDDAIESSDNSQMVGWREDGYIIGNDGDITDFNLIAHDLLDFDKRFDLQEIPYDPAMGRYFITTLINDHNLPMVEMKQGSLMFTSAAIELENFVLEKKFVFDGNPVLSWMMSNVVMSKPSKITGLRSPHKEDSGKKIDGIIALLMSISRAINHKDETVTQGFVSWA